jgi:hypothetical protein
MIGMKDLDGNAELGCTPGLELLVCIEGVRFLSEEVEEGETGTVIGEGDVVFLFLSGLDWCRLQQVRVDLLSKFCGMLVFSSPQNWLSSSLHIYAQLAEEVGCRGRLQSNTSDETLLNKATVSIPM